MAIRTFICFQMDRSSPSQKLRTVHLDSAEVSWTLQGVGPQGPNGGEGGASICSGTEDWPQRKNEWRANSLFILTWKTSDDAPGGEEMIEVRRTVGEDKGEKKGRKGEEGALS